ncbi:hypothetical protein Csa_022096 [Cucumis sativus]|uniref:Uncharacterized protein n=1 Tax=Cucumis sativus TaxID=3659 RepID=A0A0A0LL62_CUCSA|nr:hypothetical protein Csa_022096 [Cucumis sativus]
MPANGIKTKDQNDVGWRFRRPPRSTTFVRRTCRFDPQNCRFGDFFPPSRWRRTSLSRPSLSSPVRANVRTSLSSSSSQLFSNAAIDELLQGYCWISIDFCGGRDI